MLLFRAQQATQTQNFWVPQLSGNDSLRHKLGFCYWKPELSKTQKKPDLKVWVNLNARDDQWRHLAVVSRGR
jgi:hypothetical protein